MLCWGRRREEVDRFSINKIGGVVVSVLSLVAVGAWDLCIVRSRYDEPSGLIVGWQPLVGASLVRHCSQLLASGARLRCLPSGARHGGSIVSGHGAWSDMADMAACSGTCTQFTAIPAIRPTRPLVWLPRRGFCASSLLRGDMERFDQSLKSHDRRL